MAADLATSIHSFTGRSAVLDEMMRVLADYVIYGIVVVVALLWFHRDGLRSGIAFAAGALLALGIGSILASVWVEPRPFVADHFTPLISHGADGSFPSDHLLVLGALVGACWMRARLLASAALLLAVLAAVGRVFVGVHYPVDVLSGFAIGGLCGLAVWYLCRYALPLISWLDHRLTRSRLRPILLGRARDVLR